MINLLEIPEHDLPLIVLSDDRRGFIGWLIKAHTHGQYNHVMEMHEPGLLATQAITGYKEISIKKYMKPNIMLKFWKIKDLTYDQRRSWLSIVWADLRAPWMRRRYDFFGAIVGQGLAKIWPKFRYLNNPYTDYCSEKTNTHMRKSTGMPIPKQLSPSGSNNFYKTQSNMEVYGRWYGD